jgi:hypothetical protein
MRLFYLVLIAVLAAPLGCGGPSASYDSTVQGTVIVDGELAGRGRVMFHPVDDGPPAYGNIFDNGTYSLRVGQGDLDDVDGGKLKSGEYIVTIVVNMPSAHSATVGDGGPPTPGARLTAAKYADKGTTDLRATVKPGPNVIPFELEGAEVVEEEVAAESSEAADAPGVDGAPTQDADGEAATPPATEEPAQ